MQIGISSKQRTLLIALAVLIAVVRLFFVFAAPYGDVVKDRIQGLNDEPAHYNYVRHLIANHSFPIQKNHARMEGAFERGDFEYHQAPLYYLTCAVIDAVLGKKDNLIACRLVSFLFGVLCLQVLWKALAMLNLGVPVRIGAVAFWGLFFNHVYFSSFVSNDSMSWFWSLLITVYLLRLVQQESPKLSEYVKTGLLFGSGLLVKSSIMLFGPVLALAGVFVFLRDRSRSVLWNYMILFVVAGVVCSPWYIRNLLVYGSLFNLDNANGPAIHYLWEPATLVSFLKSVFPSFWLPVTNVGATLLRTALNGFSILLSMGLFAVFVANRRKERAITPVGILLSILLLLNIAGYIKYNLYWTNSDGRFLFPSALPLTLILVAPVLRDFDKKSLLIRIVGAATVVVMIVFPYLYLLTAIDSAAVV